MTWSQRMNLAIEYIESNLDSALSIEDVAKEACCSKYHFHRMFFANFKITCAEYIRRRKLTLAAVELMNTNESIVDIAFKFGYESPNTFTRAFRNIHGINPSKARLGGTSLSSYIPKPLQSASFRIAQYSPQGWFINALCCVINFEKGVTILCN